MKSINISVNSISISHLFTYVLGGYFIVTALAGFVEMLGYNGGAISRLYIYLIILYSLKFLLTNAKFLDYIFLLFILVLVISSLINNYNDHLFNVGLHEISYMSFFYLARSKTLNGNRIIKQGIPVYIIVCIIGLYLFIAMPSWYMDYKMKEWFLRWDKDRILEMMRLSAFWQYPYWISYGGAIIYTFLLYHSYLNKRMERIMIVLLAFIFLTLLLAQQRTPIYWVLFISIAYGVVKKKISIILGIFLFTIIIFASNIVSSDFVDKFINKIEDASNVSTFIQKRQDIFSSFYKKEISVFGDGIGRYSHDAYILFRQDAITDHNYMKILYENGIFGCLGFSFFIIYSIIKGIKNLKNSIFELCIVFYYIVGMLGANCISNGQQHAAIFWFCCGSLTNKYYQDKTNNL